ncbi:MULTISPECIES: sulfotransferase [unclassified Minwuia]|jgi:Sulfotransferase family|uniref:sulfotransferase n=1 Tax=unclassified Minwuia TaxID=2618799 RepID=UPI00247832FB|nr:MULTISPECIES: sulfotransferase [unclassified Minwuia]
MSSLTSDKTASPDGTAMDALPARADIRDAADRLNLIVISPLGRSGSFLIQSLFDGHPEVVCFSEVAQHWHHADSFRAAGQDISAWLDAHPEFHDGRSFAGEDASMADALATWFRQRRPQFEDAFRLAWETLNDSAEERRLYVSLAVAWAVVRGQDLDRLRYVVLQHHNNRAIAGDMPAILRAFPETRILATCRHPIESGLSFLTLDRRTGHASFRNYCRNVRGWSVTCWRNMEAVAAQLSDESRLRLLDLNTLHEDPDGILRRLALWLGISDDPALHASSVCDIPWLGNSADGAPIPTFEHKRAALIYPATIGTQKGLSRNEYRFAEWFTRPFLRSAGYADPATVGTTSLAGFLWILISHMEWFRADTIAHDRGLKRFARRLGLVETALVLKELLALRRSVRRPLAHLRLDRDPAA